MVFRQRQSYAKQVLFAAVGRGLKTVTTVCLLSFTIAGALGQAESVSATPAIAGDAAKVSGVVQLDETLQQQAGIKVASLKSYLYTPEFGAFGRVLSLQPLLDLRNRYIAAQAQYESASAALKLARQSIDRARQLQSSGVASVKVLQELESQWLTEQAKTRSLHLQLQALHDEALLAWGEKLTDAFLTPESTGAEPFLIGRRKLISVALPPGRTLPVGIDHVKLSAAGNFDAVESADLVSAAPLADDLTQGDSYFFATETAGIKPGMRLSVRLPEKQTPESGVLIPVSALIWHLGQAYVYIKSDDERFSRRLIDDYTDTGGGYFVRGALQPGDELVVTGAQMLLSEEFRGRIPDEDDD